MAKRMNESTQSIVGHVSDAMGEVEVLKDELQEWFDNLSEGLQASDTGERLTDAVEALENIDQVEPDSDLADAVGDLVVQLPYRGRRNSRRKRAGDAASQLQQVIDRLNEFAEGLRTVEDLNDPVSDEDEDKASSAESLAEELETASSELDEVDFPGMYGR